MEERKLLDLIEERENYWFSLILFIKNVDFEVNRFRVSFDNRILMMVNLNFNIV
jgi:hypothetical protein